LFTENESGDPVYVYTAGTENDEARFVVQRAKHEIEQGTPPEEIAVLYRANFQSRVLEEAFLMYGVPYQVLGTKFFEREEVKHALSYVRAALNPQSFGDITRIISVPTRGIGKTTLAKMVLGNTQDVPHATQEKINAFYATLSRIKNACESQPPSKAMVYAIKESGLEKHYSAKTEEDIERLGNLHELASLASKYDALPGTEGMEKLLEEAALATDQDELAEVKPGVKLMTVHASKGLEFDVVFITGLEEGLFPSSVGGDEDRDSEEERRLFYVALTRAKKRVVLTHATMRTVFGMPSMNAPSQFIADLNDAYVEVLNEHGATRADLGHDRGIDLIDW
jgi:DNA helicase-2/ATP-dependent DNA helicase PcrA